MTGIEPGWYKDPADPVTQRYWDGGGWIGAAIPADATPPDGPPPVDAPGPSAPPQPAGATSVTGAARAPIASGLEGPPRDSNGAGNGPVGGAPGGAPAIGAGQPTAGWSTPPAGPGQAPPPGSPPRAGWPGPGNQHPPGSPGAAAPPGWPGTLPPGATPPPGWPGTLPPGATPPPGWPYPPPGWVPPPRPHGYLLASYGARLVARIIDIGVVLGLNLVVNAWFVWQYAMEIAPIFRTIQADPFGDTPQATPRAQYLLYTILIIATALWMAYEVPALGNTGQTLGKRVMQIKVVPVEGDTRLGYGRAFRRWGRLGLWTPLWSCCIGFVFQLIDSVSLLFDRPLRQSFHDKAARTVVVQLPAASPAGGAGGGHAGTEHDSAPAGHGQRDNPTGGAR